METLEPDVASKDAIDAAVCERISVVGNTLGALLWFDPQDDGLRGIWRAISEAGVAGLNEEWPFVARNELAQSFETWVAQASNPDEEELHREYMRLFVGPQAMPCPPWGSVYTDKDRVMFGLSTVELMDWMHDRGLRVNNEMNVPADHIGTLLMTMASLASSRPELVKGLLRLHILPWAHHYLSQLESAADHPFYRSVAVVAQATMSGIQNGLEIDDVVIPRFYR